MASLPIKALHLYTAPLSGCSARIRIAANLKSIPLIHHNINISKSEQTSPSYLTVNPNGSVPSLIVEYKDNGESHSIAITQSPAIFDFLETHFPTPPLLPKIGDFQRRARALEMASLVACDIQPPQNSRIRKQITTLFNGNGEEWARYVYDRGFGVYEKFLERAGLAGFGGRYSAGDEVSIAEKDSPTLLEFCENVSHQLQNDIYLREAGSHIADLSLV